MSKEIITKASEIIKSKSSEGENIGAGIALTLIDNDGYPTTSCVSISKADGIREILFAFDLSSNRAKRAKECGRASICVFDDDYEGGSYYNITLVGDVEIVTDPDVKKNVWHDEMYGEHFEQGMADPNYAVLRFTTKRYNLWVDMGEELAGSL
jgi:general stress protein 26